MITWSDVHIQPTLLSPGDSNNSCKPLLVSFLVPCSCPTNITLTKEKQQFMETLAGFPPGSLFMSNQHYSHQGNSNNSRKPSLASFTPGSLQITLLSPEKEQNFLETLAGFPPGPSSISCCLLDFPTLILLDKVICFCQQVSANRTL